MKTVITGASRGIGKSIAGKLLEEGHEVIGTSRSKKHHFAQNPGYRHLVCDLAKPEEVEKMQPLFEESTIPEVLINNAGMFEAADFEVSDNSWLETWDKTLQVNLRAAALISKWAVQCWKQAGIHGRIINISSRAASRGDTQEYAAYAASKAGLTAFTKSMARSFGRFGITAYAIAPGFVDTDMARESISVYGADYLTKDLALESIAPPEQIAELTYLLAQGKLTHATGQTFHVNSGSYLV